MLKSAICDMLKIKYPVFQGGMAHIADADLAAAVSNGGGLGIISAMNYDAKYLKGQIDKARSLTDKPFGVNVMLMSPHTDEVAKLLADEKVSVITTGAGNPEKYMKMWNDAGIKVIPVVASTALAKIVERLGASAVIAEGGESGGHVGDTTTMALVPQVCDAVSVPVLAAGGIADGRGMAAALMLGAVGVQIGTRFLVATECNVHQNYKNKVLKAGDISTIVTGKRLGHPVRSIKTPFSRAYAKAEYSDISDNDLENMAVGALRLAAVEGDEKNGCFLAGQVAGMVNKEQSAKEIIEEICTDAEKILKGAEKWVN
ncbi:nitronate monooxygenase [Qingrenia yutianensis]|uniref:Probable nitronate monooxygenase n=1 Tax=Qingrenia yutianensis TaxID=2763676 RepID=A0A926F973_9FIRM|nr:nitronate monooxygenase [Qingrenia yutianensis]MBC8596603.1 nitronate monooxygenase [Qingrenia yutianensis]